MRQKITLLFTLILFFCSISLEIGATPKKKQPTQTTAIQLVPTIAKKKPCKLNFKKPADAYLKKLRQRVISLEQVLSRFLDTHVAAEVSTQEQPPKMTPEVEAMYS